MSGSLLVHRDGMFQVRTFSRALVATVRHSIISHIYCIAEFKNNLLHLYRGKENLLHDHSCDHAIKDVRKESKQKIEKKGASGPR
jgi:hypothetical protein